MAIKKRLGGKKKRDESGRFASTDKTVSQRRYIRALKNRLVGSKQTRVKSKDLYNEKGQLKKRTGKKVNSRLRKKGLKK